jgi:hypothetical protein
MVVVLTVLSFLTALHVLLVIFTFLVRRKGLKARRDWYHKLQQVWVQNHGSPPSNNGNSDNENTNASLQNDNAHTNNVTALPDPDSIARIAFSKGETGIPQLYL